MKVLVIGNGGREHAIVWKLAQSPLVTQIYVVPGNGGTAQIATNLNIPSDDLEQMAKFAVENEIELTVVGPDAYLAEGTVDLFQAQGLRVYGPTQAAARLEWSKSYAKEFMGRYRIPTGKFATFTTPEAAKAYVRETGVPIVIKADGLAAGKGVTVAFDLETAGAAIDRIMVDKAFGAAGASLVVEEYLAGEEASLLAFCDGKIAVPMLPAQDHKPIGEGDTGPNTGGMGTYAPTTAFTPELLEQVMAEIVTPTMAGMAAEGTPFVGTMFLGLMITKDGPKVIEYNVRFGDPETQVVLPLLESDLAPIMLAACDGRLAEVEIKWRRETTAVCVVAASAGYPGKFTTGIPITGLEEVEDSLIFQAGTKQLAEGKLVTSGGRVLNVVRLGKSIAEAIDGAYADLRQINFEGIYYRGDIGHRELKRQPRK